MKRSKKAVVAQAEPKPVKAESRAVLAIRIPLQDRARLRQAAGWGNLQSFVYDAVMVAIEKAEKK